MSEDRYQRLQDAITKARVHPHDYWCAKEQVPGASCNCNNAVHAHLDTLQAALDLHKPGRNLGLDTWTCAGCSGSGCEHSWPCPDVLTVETALRNMGCDV